MASRKTKYWFRYIAFPQFLKALRIDAGILKMIYMRIILIDQIHRIRETAVTSFSNMAFVHR